MGCLTDQLSADIAIDCDNIVIPGLESDAILIPYSEFDKSGSTINATIKTLLDDLKCKSGANGYKIEGVKQLNTTNSEFVPSEDRLDGHRHTFNFRVLSPSAANREQASKVAKGERYVVVVNRKWKGANNADAFLVYGFDSGLYCTTWTENPNENDGAILITLASKDTSLEREIPRNLLIGDYDATLIAFNNKFIEA